MPTLARKVKNKFECLSDSTQRIASVLTAIFVVCGAFAGGVSYIVNQLDAHITEQTKELKLDIDDVKLSSTRNELLIMMKVDPNNVMGIERLAKYYFVNLKGDMYMTGMYSDWAKQYGGDTSFVVYHN